MEALKCELCGSNEIIKKDGIYVCEHCGTKYTVEEAKKLLGTVKIDNSERIENLYDVARRAIESSNYESAQKYYEMILVDDPKSWEATFFSMYAKVMQCKIIEIESSASLVKNSMLSIFKLVKDNVEGIDEQKKVVAQICQYLIKCAATLKESAKAHYNEIDSSIKDNYTQEYVDRLIQCTLICYGAGDFIYGLWTEFLEQAAVMWGIGISIHNEYLPYIAPSNRAAQENIKQQYSAKIQKFKPDFQAPAAKSNGCYIATAVYGNYDCPEVWTLRRFRDYILATNFFGRLFIKTYYATSPTIVKLFGKRQWFTTFFRKRLDKFVAKLQSQGLSSDKYEDIDW